VVKRDGGRKTARRRFRLSITHVIDELLVQRGRSGASLDEIYGYVRGTLNADIPTTTIRPRIYTRLSTSASPYRKRYERFETRTGTRYRLVKEYHQPR